MVLDAKRRVLVETAENVLPKLVSADADLDGKVLTVNKVTFL